MRLVLFVVAISAVLSGCAGKTVLKPGPNALVEDMGWKSRTALTVGAAPPAVAATNEEAGAKPAPARTTAQAVRKFKSKPSAVPAMAAGLDPDVPLASRQPSANAQTWRTDTAAITSATTGKVPAPATAAKPSADAQAWQTKTATAKQEAENTAKSWNKNGTCYSAVQSKCGSGCQWITASNGKSGFCTAAGPY